MWHLYHVPRVKVRDFFVNILEFYLYVSSKLSNFAATSTPKQQNEKTDISNNYYSHLLF